LDISDLGGVEIFEVTIEIMRIGVGIEGFSG